MTSRVVVMGVVGKSNVDDSRLRLIESAWSVGKLIAMSGNIVLTGGYHKFSEKSVKHHAILGAFDAAKADRKVGVLGIPPSKISTARGKTIGTIEQNSTSDRLCSWVYPHTGLSSEERNPLTGQTPDVLIALEGEDGTPQEVSEAIKAGRQVVFLNSWAVLKDKLTAAPRELHIATTEQQAVELALRLTGPEIQLRGGFPSNYPLLSSDFCRRAQDATAWLREQVVS